MDTRHINLLTLIPSDFKRNANTDGGEYVGTCPFCGGKDRFHIWPNPVSGNPRFWCRRCNAKGDAIEYVKLCLPGTTFKEACDYLRIQPSQSSVAKPKAARRPTLVSKEKASVALTEPEWQQSAAQFCGEATNRLWSQEGKQALAYLLGRKLTENVIHSAHLGYNPVTHREQWGSLEVWLFAGIVIPWLIGGMYWKVNIRRRPSDLRSSDKRYIQAAGGANGLYLADNLKVSCTAIITEGEIDALTIYSQAARLVTEMNVIAVATGCTTNARLTQHVATLAKADRMLVAYDDDENQAGDEAAEWWLHIFGDKALRLRPTRHDVNKMAEVGEDLSAWIMSAL